jgi:ribosomal protein S18 acetylase RimI-like enzyme
MSLFGSHEQRSRVVPRKRFPTDSTIECLPSIQPVRTRADLLDALDAVRRAGGAPLTNWFAAPDRIDDWIHRNALSTLPAARSLLILRRDRGFQRLYHVAADLEALAAALQTSAAELAAQGHLTADLIGRPQDLEPVTAIYRGGGFQDHNCLVRLSRMTPPQEAAAPDPAVEFAAPADLPAAAAFLARLLDPYTDHIPDDDELRDAALRRTLLLVRRGDSIGGILLFENTGITSHLRYWYVGEGFRNQGIGARLIREFFRLSAAAKRIILWVVRDNTDAIAKYHHYGFRPETLIDRIMLRKG